MAMRMEERNGTPSGSLTKGSPRSNIEPRHTSIKASDEEMQAEEEDATPADENNSHRNMINMPKSSFKQPSIE